MPPKSQKKTMPAQAAGKPKKRDRAASEIKLIQAAEATFSKYGYAGTTTKLIAQKAKLNEALIARYFDGKMGLLFAVIRRHVEGMKGTLPYPPCATLGEEIRCYVENNYKVHCAENEDFFKIVLSQALIDAKFAKRFREEVSPNANPDLVARLQKFVTAGKMRKDLNTEEFVDSLERQIMGIMLFERLLLDRPNERVEELLSKAATMYTELAET